MLPSTSVPCGKTGLLTHYAAVNREYATSTSVISSDPRFELAALFGPQHGFLGETQDNMIEWEGYTHPELGIPVYSLYSHLRDPLPRMLEDLDCLVVDLQDAGSRYYTYVYTMALSMRRCASMGISVVILDRPNPVGMTVVEGKALDPDYSSFVGMYPIPVRHALTIGELAILFSRFDGLPEPHVVRMQGWSPDGFPADAPWVHPSPNMPTIQTAQVYPGMCLLEATNLSEGRGTSRPFEIFGAPWIDGVKMAAALNGSHFLKGATLRPHSFIPTFGKHCGIACGGAQIHLSDPFSFRPLLAAFGILAYVFSLKETAWKEPPYEYEYDRMPIDILTGCSDVREAVEEKESDLLTELATGDPAAHTDLVSGSLLYEREFRK